MPNTTTILLCGVGGQGTILAADVIARCAIAAGDDVKLSEIHGMSQRGGSVSTVVRIGSEVSSMVADLGTADFLLSFETTEGLRNLPFLATNGCALVNDESIKTMTVVSGAQKMPERPRKTLKEHGAHVLPADLLAAQAGTAKAANIVLIGALAQFMPYPDELWIDVIKSRVPEKFVDINITAFHAGKTWVESHLSPDEIHRYHR